MVSSRQFYSFFLEQEQESLLEIILTAETKWPTCGIHFSLICFISFIHKYVYLEEGA